MDGAAAAKKAAFLKEAEEAVRRATLQVPCAAVPLGPGTRTLAPPAPPFL